MTHENKLLDEFKKVEDSFYNIDIGLIQHPDLVAFARTLEYFKQLMITNFQTHGNCNNNCNVSSIGNDFIDKLQLQQLSNNQ